MLSDYAEAYLCLDPLGPRTVVLQTSAGVSHQLAVAGSETGVDLLQLLSKCSDVEQNLDPSRVRLIFNDKDYADDDCALTLDAARIPDGARFVICERFGFEDRLRGGVGGVTQQHLKVRSK